MNFAAEEKNQAPGLLLLAAFVGFLGWYFCASYIGRQGSWQTQQPRILTPHDDLFGIDGRPDGNQVVVGRFGLILLSRDGGQNWQGRPSGTTQALSAASFADARHGFIVGSHGTILTTGDGGVSWRAQRSGTSEQLLGVYASSPMVVHVVGAFGTLVSTFDGGRTWRHHQFSWGRLIPLITKESGMLQPNLNAVYFADPETGWIVGEFGLILHTVDGGRTWIAQAYGSNRPQLFAVAFRDKNTGWSVGQRGAVLRTTDGGRHWVPVDLGTRRSLYGISFAAGRGLIVGDDVVLSSEDEGSSWSKLDKGPENHWLSGATVGNRQATVVGQGGTIRVLDLSPTILRPEGATP